MSSSSPRFVFHLLTGFLALATLAAGTASAKVPSLGDVPIDRRFRGRIESLSGRRVKLVYDFDDPKQLQDFFYDRPFDHQGSGTFEWVDGKVRAAGIGGLRLDAVFEPDIVVTVKMAPGDPDRDIGLFLTAPRGLYHVMLFAAHESIFSAADGRAPGSQTIVELGGAKGQHRGGFDFRWVSQIPHDRIRPGVEALFRAEREGTTNRLRIDKSENNGKDYTSHFDVVAPGLYVGGGRATFDELVIEGTIDEDWLTRQRVALFLMDDLEHKANRLTKYDRKLVEFLAAHPGETDPMNPAEAVGLLGLSRVNVLLRERLAEELPKRAELHTVLLALEPLLGSKDDASRALGQRLLEACSPFDFGYSASATEASRQASADRAMDYARTRDEKQKAGLTYLAGAWRTREEVEVLRKQWEHAWEIPGPRVWLRTNLPEARAQDLSRLLEAGYDACRAVVGLEPRPEDLPLTVFVFAKKDEYTEWCRENGRDEYAHFYRLVVDEDRLGLTAWEQNRADDVLNVLARLYLRSATGAVMPLWYEQGFCSFFCGNGVYRWSRGELALGHPLSKLGVLRSEVGGEGWLPLDQLIAIESADLRADPKVNEMFYFESWALWRFLHEDEASQSRWSEFVGRARGAGLDEGNHNKVGAEIFRQAFEGRMDELEARWRKWLVGLR